MDAIGESVKGIGQTSRQRSGRQQLQQIIGFFNTNERWHEPGIVLTPATRVTARAR